MDINRYSVTKWDTVMYTPAFYRISRDFRICKFKHIVKKLVNLLVTCSAITNIKNVI